MSGANKTDGTQVGTNKLKMKKKKKLVQCEKCNNDVAIIYYEYCVFCADCALLVLGIPFRKIMAIEDKGLSKRIQ